MTHNVFLVHGQHLTLVPIVVVFLLKSTWPPVLLAKNFWRPSLVSHCLHVLCPPGLVLLVPLLEVPAVRLPRLQSIHWNPLLVRGDSSHSDSSSVYEMSGWYHKRRNGANWCHKQDP